MSVKTKVVAATGACAGSSPLWLLNRLVFAEPEANCCFRKLKPDKMNLIKKVLPNFTCKTNY